MAFTEEQEASILAFISKAATQTPAATPAEVKPADPVKPAEDYTKTKTIAEEARAQLEAEKNNVASVDQIKDSVKFNMVIGDFVEKNKTLLPEEASKILSNASTKTFKDENEKANAIRKNLLDSFLSKQENIESLTVSMLTRANEYKSLAESDKEKRSSEFWDLAEIGVVLKQGIKKAEALNKVNGVSTDGGSRPILELKTLAKAKEKFKLK